MNNMWMLQEGARKKNHFPLYQDATPFCGVWEWGHAYFSVTFFFFESALFFSPKNNRL